MNNNGRAETPDDKKQIINRILAAWVSNPHQRLGQLIENALNGKDLFFIEDRALAEILENYTKAIL